MPVVGNRSCNIICEGAGQGRVTVLNGSAEQSRSPRMIRLKLLAKSNSQIIQNCEFSRFENVRLVATTDDLGASPVNGGFVLNSSGAGYLQLCAGAEYLLQSLILFAAPQQEISTVGYPAGDERATVSLRVTRLPKEIRDEWMRHHRHSSNSSVADVAWHARRRP
ncbi:hypothetical protein DFS33DRAFT_987723 [Desarmillaria ectypa]|nr:hypothetical protein DFS33DRAFT_987723 [Desarmillaria ectypa]